jgi:hypothetical protein
MSRATETGLPSRGKEAETEVATEAVTETKAAIAGAEEAEVAAVMAVVRTRANTSRAGASRKMARL